MKLALTRPLATFALTISLLFADGAAAQFSFGGIRNSLIQFALEQVSVEGVFEIRAASIEQPEDGATDLVGVEVADRDGVWLTVDTLSLRWNGAALLSGTLDIQRLGARGVNVLRRPIPPAVTVKPDARIAQGPSRGLLDWPRSPIALRLGTLALENVRLAAGVAAPDRAIAFDASGSAQDAGDVQSAALSITRIDEVAGKIAFSFARDFADQSLKLALDATEDAGGLTAALIGLPDRSGARIKLNADGPLADWRLSMAAEADQVMRIDVNGAFDVTGPIQAEARVRVRPGDALSPDIAAAIGAEAVLDLRVAEDDQGVVTVRTGRLRSPSLTLDLSGAYARPGGRIDFTVALAALEPLSRAVDAVDFTRIGFDGRVTGTLDALTAKGALDLTGLMTAPVDLGRAQLTLDMTKTGDLIAATLSGAASGVRIDKLSPQLMGATDIAVNGVWDGAARRAELSALSIVSPLLSVTGSGVADVGGDLADLRWTLSTPDLEPVAAAYGADAAGRLSAQGRAEGALSAPRLVGTLSAQALRVAGERLGALTMSHDLSLGAAPAGRIDLTATGGRFGPAALGTRFAFADGVLTLDDLAANAMEARLTGRARVDTATMLTDAQLDLDAARLAALAPVFAALDLGAPPRGALRGTVALKVEDGRQNADLALSGAEIAALGHGLGELTIDAAVTDALGAPAATGRISASRLVGPDGIAVGAVVLDGAARDLLGAPSADLTFDVTDIEGPGGVSVARASGRIDARDLTGNPAAVLSAVIEELSAPGATARSVDVAADLTGLSGAPRGTIAIKAANIEAGGARVPSATLDARLTGANGTGSATGAMGAMDATDATGATDVAAVLTVPSARMGEAQIGTLTITANAADALGAPRLDLRASLGASAAGGATLTSLSASAKGPLGSLAIALSAAGALPDGRAATMSAAARADLSGEDIRATISGFAVDLAAGEGRDPLPAARIALDAPLTLRSGAQGQRLDGIALSLPGGRLTGRVALGVRGGATGALELAMDDLRPVARLADLPLEAGALSLSATFDTGAGRGALSASGTGLRPTGIDRLADALALSADGVWAGGRLKTSARVDGRFGDPIVIDADLPLRAAGLVPVMPADGTIDAGVKWTGEIGPLWAFVPLADHLLNGRADIDLRAGGTVAKPRPAGRLRLTDGRYENLETGTILTNLTLTSGLAANGAMTLDLTADDGAGKPLAATAMIADGRIDARLTSEAAVLVRRDDATAAISLDIAAAGPLGAPAITGEVLIDRAEIRLVNAMPPAVADLGVIEIKGAPPRPTPDPGASEGGPTLDLKIRAPGGIFVRGRGLTSEWAADLSVTGPAGAPKIVGVIEKRRGELRLLSRPFELTRGRIVFDGGSDVDPTLDVALELDRDGFIGRIAVRGRASAPEISLESSPPLPEEEVLPRMLFGQSRQSLSAAQATELASAAAALASGDEGFIGALRETAGLDVLSVDTGGDNGPSVSVGSTVAAGVYVGAKQPVDGGPTEVQVEVEIFDNFTIDGTAGGTGETTIGLDWKIDF
jgi:translocation and assembly module TamB